MKKLFVRFRKMIFGFRKKSYHVYRTHDYGNSNPFMLTVKDIMGG